MSAFIRSLVPSLLTFLLACAGCATSGGDAGPARSAAEFAKVVPGKTTEAEVRAVLGTPARAHHYRAEAGETWEYPYYGNYERRIFWIEFSAGKVVSRTDDTSDFYAGKYKGW
jgi:outer membrane protein assembly factor BamE (lipoprotein component of BamABCDE complex)